MLLTPDTATQMPHVQGMQAIGRALSICEDRAALDALYNAILTIQHHCLARSEPARTESLNTRQLQEVQALVRKRCAQLDRADMQRIREGFGAMVGQTATWRALAAELEQTRRSASPSRTPQAHRASEAVEEAPSGPQVEPTTTPNDGADLHGTTTQATQAQTPTRPLSSPLPRADPSGRRRRRRRR